MYEKYIIPKESLSHVKFVRHTSPSVQVNVEDLEKKVFWMLYVRIIL